MYCKVDGSNSLLKRLTEDQKKWIVRAYDKNISPTKVRGEFFQHYQILKGMIRAKYKLTQFLRVNQRFEKTSSVSAKAPRQRNKTRRRSDIVEEVSNLLEYLALVFKYICKYLNTSICKYFFKYIMTKSVARCTSSSISTQDVNSESSLDSDAEDYFGFPNKNNSIETSKSMSIEGQVLAYLNDKSHSLQSLEKHPIIKTLFMRYNTTIPSSVPVERLFSLAGITLTPKRSKLSDKTLEMLVLLRANGKHQ